MPWTAYTWLRSRVRATGPVAEALAKANLRPRMIATTNPGGAFHQEVKAHFVDPMPPGKIYRDKESTLTRCYIPATLEDNPAMPRSYRNMLMSLDPDKRKALLEGSWDILEGVRFGQFDRRVHVISPDEFPAPILSGERVIAVDYGFADPFVALYGLKLGNGIVLIHRELYATELTAVQQAQLILESTPQMEWHAGTSVYADPSMWGRRDASAPKLANNAAPMSSAAYDYEHVLGFPIHKAWNDRLTGWGRVDEKLRIHPDGYPRLLIHDTCTNLIRTLPALQRSKSNPDDISSSPKQDDHCADSLRYLLLALDPKSTHPTKESLRVGGKRITAGIMSRSF